MMFHWVNCSFHEREPPRLTFRAKSGSCEAMPFHVMEKSCARATELWEAPHATMVQREMNSRERWRLLLEGCGSDRPVCDFWGTSEVVSRLLRDLDCASELALWRKLGIDKAIHLSPQNSQALEKTWHIQSQFSVWGVATDEIPYGNGLGAYVEAVGHPFARCLSPADIEQYGWPDPHDWCIDGFRSDCERWSEYPVIACSFEPFYLYSRMRGMELALTDMLDEPAILDAALERIYWIHDSIIRRTLSEAADLIDCVYVAEDLGTQESLLISPALFRRFLKPWLARMIELVHSFGVHVFFHSDGAIRPLIGELLDIGVDVLNPVQWRCRGMDRSALARDFGDRVVFHGGIDNQRTLPYGSRADVVQQVRENIELFRKTRGYIVAPCHNLQANTPTENIVALYEAVHERHRVLLGTGR